MFEIKSFKRNRIGQKNLIGIERKRKINFLKSCILTIGLLATLTLVSCSKEDNSSTSIGDQSSSVSKSETGSKFKLFGSQYKLKLLPLCNSNENLVDYSKTKEHWINICGQRNKKFLVIKSRSKSKSDSLIRLPAYWNKENSVFLASNKDTIYAVSEKDLKVWEHDDLKVHNISSSKSDIINTITHLKLTKVFKAISVGILLAALYIYGKPYIHRLGSNGRAIAYVVSIVAWPGIVVACLAIAEIPLGLLASLTAALAFGFSFGSQKVVENVATVALNLRDDVYEVDDIIGFAGDDDFYQVAAIKTSAVKLVSLAGSAGRILNISPSVLAQKEFVNYTQDGHGTLCKWVFPISLKAQVAQPGKGDMTKMEDTLLQAAKEVQTWIIQNTKHPEARAAFAAEASKEKGRQDIPAGVFLTKVEKFIHHYAVALWVPGIEIYRVAAISNELFHHVWHHAVEHHDIELATPDTGDDTDMVEATQAIAQSLRESLGKVSKSNGNLQPSIKS